MFFSKCGVVDKVVNLTEKTNGHTRRSAYVSFANKEFVDKAVARSFL